MLPKVPSLLVKIAHFRDRTAFSIGRRSVDRAKGKRYALHHMIVAGKTADVYVTRDGLIYASDWNAGLHAFECLFGGGDSAAIRELT